MGLPVERAEGPAGSGDEGVPVVLPRLRLLGMTRKAYVMGVVMFSLVVCGLLGWVWLLLVSAPSVGLDGTQNQARPSLEQRAVPGEGALPVRGLRWKRALPEAPAACWGWGVRPGSGAVGSTLPAARAPTHPERLPFLDHQKSRCHGELPRRICQPAPRG